MSTDSLSDGRRRSLVKVATLAFWLAVTVLPIIGIVVSLVDPLAFDATKERYHWLADDYPVVGPLLFIGFQALQVVLAPISHYSVGYLGGFLYGTYPGAVYNWIGRVLGHCLAFLVSRRVGRSIAVRFVSQSAIAKYDKYVSKGYIILFLMYFLPLFPDDELSYLAGLSRMRFKWFLLANLLGQVGGSLGLAYLGSGIDTKDTLFWILSIIMLTTVPVLWFALNRRAKQVGRSG